MSADSTGEAPKCRAAELRKRLAFDDRRLLAECEVQRYRSGGPGGQHRNKVASAIRLRHKPSGLVAIAHESRLQQENQRRALRRLRQAIALVARAPLPQPMTWPERVQVSQGQIRVREDNPAFPEALALVLDALSEHGGRVSDAARALGLTTSSLNRFLKNHPKVWREAGRIRASAGLPPLR